MSICTRVVISVSFHQVNAAPYAKSCSEGNNKGLQYINCTCKKTHSKMLKPVLRRPRGTIPLRFRFLSFLRYSIFMCWVISGNHRGKRIVLSCAMWLNAGCDYSFEMKVWIWILEWLDKACWVTGHSGTSWIEMRKDMFLSLHTKSFSWDKTAGMYKTQFLFYGKERLLLTMSKSWNALDGKIQRASAGIVSWKISQAAI